jgi:hypothetical protein
MVYPLLSKTNIVNSNTIQAADVSQSINAFTGVTEYRIIVSGSLNVNGNIICLGSNSNSQSGFTGSLYGTASYANTASYGYAYTSSNITSASFSYNSSYTSGSLQGFLVRSGSDSANTAVLYPIGMLSGTSYIRSGNSTQTVLFTATPFPAGATLGSSVWITISQFSNRSNPSNWDSYITVRSITTSSIDFQTRTNNPAPNDLPFTFTCVYQTS